MYTLDNLDNSIYNYLANIDLELKDIRCGLNHGIDYEDNPLAIDYFCQKIENDGDIITLQIPICAECIAALHSEFQILFICLNCSSTQWLFRGDSKKLYPKDLHVLYFKRCPKCNV